MRSRERERSRKPVTEAVVQSCGGGTELRTAVLVTITAVLATTYVRAAGSPFVAWEPLGFRPAWFAEIDPFCSALLAHRYPDVENLGDFTAIDAPIASDTFPSRSHISWPE